MAENAHSLLDDLIAHLWKEGDPMWAEHAEEAKRVMADMLAALEKVLEYEMSDWKSQQEFGGYVLDDDVRETVQQAIRLAKEGRK